MMRRVLELINRPVWVVAFRFLLPNLEKKKTGRNWTISASQRRKNRFQEQSTENLSSPTSEKHPVSFFKKKKNKTDLYFTPNKQSNEGNKAKFDIRNEWRQTHLRIWSWWSDLSRSHLDIMQVKTTGTSKVCFVPNLTSHVHIIHSLAHLLHQEVERKVVVLSQVDSAAKRPDRSSDQMFSTGSRTDFIRTSSWPKQVFLNQNPSCFPEPNQVVIVSKPKQNISAASWQERNAQIQPKQM